jgi:hypothetical protein
MAEPTQLYRLIEERLDGTLAEFVAAKRPHTTWRQMASEITQLTGIEVSSEGLRQWFADRIQIEVKVT